MSKNDSANNAITRATDSSYGQMGAGINDTQNRVNTLTPRSDAEREEIQNNFRGYAETGGLDQSGIDRLRATGYSTPGSGGGGGGGGSDAVHAGVNTSVNTPDYLKTFGELMGSSGGFDAGRLSNIEGDVSRLRNAKSMYGATDRSIAGLQDIGRTGGITDEDMNEINRPLFQEFEKTGGYTDADKQNVRNRATRSTAGVYGALQDKMKMDRARNPYGVGFGGANFKLAREAAQGIGQTASDAEIGINDSVRTGRMDAGKTLADNQLRLLPIRTGNQLRGLESAGQLDLGEQAQIQDATAKAGGLDLGTQGLINQTRLGAGQATSQDTLGRMSIDAQSRAASASNSAMMDYYNRSLQSNNERAILGMGQSGREFGSQGLLNTYGTAPAELMGNQRLLLDYRNGLADQQQGLINSRVGLAGQNSSMMGNMMGTAGSILSIPGIFGGGRDSSHAGGAGGGSVQPNNIPDYRSPIYNNQPSDMTPGVTTSENYEGMGYPDGTIYDDRGRPIYVPGTAGT